MKTNYYPQVIGWQSWLPNKGNVIFTVLMIAVTLWAQSAGAITLGATTATNPTATIPYQGYLTDADSQPLSGPQNMTFKLYNQPTGGSPLWTENRQGANSISIDGGLFNVMLGSVTSLSQSVVTENDILYLGIAIGADTEMTPRVQLGSMPDPRNARPSYGEALAEFNVWNIPLTVTDTELSGTRVEVDLDTPQVMIVTGHFDFITSGGGAGVGGLYVDGSRVSKSAVLLNTGRSTVGQTWILELSAGTHTLYLSAMKTGNTGTAKVVDTFTNLTWLSFAQ